MSCPTSPCCIVVLDQQQEQSIYEQNQPADTSVHPNKRTSKKCTVVENGLVVVKELEVSQD